MIGRTPLRSTELQDATISLNQRGKQKKKNDDDLHERQRYEDYRMNRALLKFIFFDHCSFIKFFYLYRDRREENFFYQSRETARDSSNRSIVLVRRLKRRVARGKKKNAKSPTDVILSLIVFYCLL